jgi:hypothetical protein
LGTEAVRDVIKTAARASDPTPVHKLVAVLASGLRFRYQARHKKILDVVAKLFECLGPESHPLADKILISLAEVLFMALG